MRKSVTISTLILFLILLTFLPRLFSLSAHWASDEKLWMRRSRDFFFALETGKFADTYVAYHPGVTTCWLGSVAIWNKYRHGSFPKSWFYSDRFLSPDMLASIRFPIASVTGVLVLIAGILLYRLFRDWKIAWLGTLFLAAEPFLLAESRRAHTDVLTSLFLFLSLLLWLCYLESETPRQRDLIFSGIYFAFACLTKSLAGAFIFFLPLLLGWYFTQSDVPWVKLLWGTFLWIMSALLTAIITWPYLWTITYKFWNLPMFPVIFVGCSYLLIYSSRKLKAESPPMLTRIELLVLGYGILIIGIGLLSAVNAIVARMYWALTEVNSVPTLFLGEIRYNPGPFYFPVMWFVWSMPLTFPLISYAMYRAWQQRHLSKKTFRVIVVLGFFALFYFIGLSFVAKKISRYIIIFLPVVCLLITLGSIQIAQLFKTKHLQFFVLVMVIILQIAPVLRLHPHYRTYYYPLLSATWVSKNTSSITGAGLDLAADYLNALPDAQHLRVQLSSLFTYDLAHYFVGHATQRKIIIDSHLNFDYEVEHLYDKQIQGTPVDPPPRNTIPYLNLQPYKERSRELEHVVRLNGIDYVWIYRVLK